MNSFSILTSVTKMYNEVVRAEVEKFSGGFPHEVFTDEDIQHLPEPVKQYFRKCGYLGKEKMMNAEVIYSDSYIKMAPDKKWMKLRTKQFNSVPEPMRASYMNARLWGIIPFEGRDFYGGGYGSMCGKLAKLFTVIHADEPEIAQSALIIILAEALLIPSYALKKYIEWSEVDSHTAKARLRSGGFDVCGIFNFNDAGEFVHFETNDRFYAIPGGGYKKVKYSIFVDRYRDMDGILIPTVVCAVWHLDEGDFEYWRGTISEIHYNVYRKY